MNIFAAGGVGEHGRNCFFIESKSGNFLFDCGIMPGAFDPYPQLNKSQTQSAEWLFISHSHVDHTGAYDWLCEHGFRGCVVMTKETSNQLPFSPEKLCLIDIATPGLKDFYLSKDLSVMWGKSGQCAGSVWFKICAGEDNVLFSGDYVEDTLVYRCDPIRHIAAKFAILDSAYGDSEASPADYRTTLVDTVHDFLKQGKVILFPVPKYGRGLELMMLFSMFLPHVPVKLDAHLQNELSRVKEYAEWIKPEFFENIESVHFCESGDKGFVFISDPQLKTKEGQKAADDIIDRHGAVILTGHEDIGSYSEMLVATKQAVSLRYAVHMSNAERRELESVNFFQQVISYHR